MGLSVRETNSQANEVAITFCVSETNIQLWREPVTPVRVRGVSCDSRAALPQRLPLMRTACIRCGASCTQFVCASLAEAGPPQFLPSPTANAAWRDSRRLDKAPISN